MNELELDFLFRLSFKLTVTREDYDAFVEQIYEAVSPIQNSFALETSTAQDSSNNLMDIKSRLPLMDKSQGGMHRSNSESTLCSSMLSGSSTPLRSSAQANESVQTGKGFYVMPEP